MEPGVTSAMAVASTRGNLEFIMHPPLKQFFCKPVFLSSSLQLLLQTFIQAPMTRSAYDEDLRTSARPQRRHP
jgi:hypothetical protein